MTMHATSKVSIVQGAEVPLGLILDFCRKTYGPHSHQAKPGYYQWAYIENPNCPDGLGSLVIALDERSHVVGTMNRLQIEWDVMGIPTVLPALGDFAVAPAHRRGGLGLRLALNSTRNVEHAFVNGSNPNSSPLFRALKYQEMTGGKWYRKLLHPMRASRRYLLYRLGRSAQLQHRLFSTPLPSGYHVSQDPDGDLLAAMATLLNSAPAGIKPHWTAATVRWRFFHPLGPRHMLLYAHDDAGIPTNAMIISVGVRMGLYVCRPVAHQCTGPSAFRNLLQVAIGLLRRSRIHMLMAFTFNKDEAKAFNAVGMHAQKDPPATFFHHRRKADAMPPDKVLIQGAASDLGMEAMPGGT